MLRLTHRQGTMWGMWTLVIIVGVATALLAAVVWVGNKQRRGNRPGEQPGGKVSSRATGTTKAYHKEL